VPAPTLISVALSATVPPVAAEEVALETLFIAVKKALEPTD
jgi:hypothetical protein